MLYRRIYITCAVTEDTYTQNAQLYATYNHTPELKGIHQPVHVICMYIFYLLEFLEELELQEAYLSEVEKELVIDHLYAL